MTGRGIDQVLLQPSCPRLHEPHIKDASEVENAIQRNGLNFVRNLGRSLNDMQVHVVVAVPQPARIDKAKALAALPWGKKSLETVQGGMELPCGKDTSSEASQDVTVIANAAITVSLDLS